MRVSQLVFSVAIHFLSFVVCHVYHMGEGQSAPRRLKQRTSD